MKRALLSVYINNTLRKQQLLWKAQNKKAAYEVLVKEKVFVAGAELNDARRVVGGRSHHCLSVRSLEVRLYHLEIFAIAQRHAPNLRTFVPETEQINTSKL